MKPVVGVSSYARDGEPLSFSVPCAYVDAVRAAGAIPLVLPAGEQDPRELLELIDGLVLSGGGDISPSAYQGQPHETIYKVCEERDAFDFGLVRAALQQPELPVLCICRGMQVLNVVCGGTLHAHLPEAVGEEVVHRAPPRRPTRHSVRLDPESRLARHIGLTEFDAWSWHHQGIDRLGQRLRAVAWADDGVIEAVEHEDHPWCFGVQWHPEMQHEEAPHAALFRSFLRAAGKE
jgi:putative glutamine amidotransferase